MRALAIIALVAAVALAAPFNDLNMFGYQSQANSGAVVTNGNARFTVLTNHVIRMEYSGLTQFEDRATLAIVNRKLPVPTFSQSTSNGVLTITTSALTLTYQVGQAFGPSTLKITTVHGGNWYFGQQDNGNLLGTIKSLDEICNPSLNCSVNADIRVHSESLHCAWGVVSRNGWTTIDDSQNFILSAVEGEWFDNNLRSTSDFDVYFFGHGTNYKAALYDFIQLSGKPQLTDRSLLGSWFTRWYDYDNDDLVRLIDVFKKTGIPLDVLILDMNWHKKDSWTGFSFDTQLFPVPSDTIAMVQSKGLKIGANIHDAVGFGNWEDKYTVMANAVGIDPATGNTVPFMLLNETYMHTMEDQVLKQLGFDIWWIDWQQGGNWGGCSGGRLNPTFITDHVRSTDGMRRKDNTRSNILARWGGLGNHRYPVGFSGDVAEVSWQCFAYQPYFVATAANVAYGVISNDLVGPPSDHELHVRWMQFGAFSPILRIHDRGMSSGGCMGSDECAIVDIWTLPYQYMDAIRLAMAQRNELLPYMYTESRKAYDTGLSMLHPMYYEFPTDPSAYLMDGTAGNAQYMFGSDMFVCPITVASGQTNLLVNQTIWIPAGTWYDEVFGQLVSGSTTISLTFTLRDTPRYTRAGAVIPKIPNPTDIGVAGSQFSAVDWHIYPGTTVGSGTMYEDDGNSLSYITGSYAFTTVGYSTSGTTMTIHIGAANGTFTNQPASRNVRLVLVGTLPLTGATINGNAVNYARFPNLGDVSYTYDGKQGSVIIDLGTQSTSQSVVVTATFVQQDQTPSLTSKMRVFAERTMLAKRLTDNWQETPFEQQPGPGYTKQAAARAGYISAVAGTHPNFAVTLMGSAYPLLVNQAMTELGGYPSPTSATVPELTYFINLFDFSRQDFLLCGTNECILTNQNYQFMWFEGFRPASPSPNAVTMYDYFGNGNDNWATTNTTTPPNYVQAIFTDGHAYKTGGPGYTCIDVWWNEAITDHMTTSSKEGAVWAATYGYAKVNSCIGYVSTTDASGGRPTHEQAMAHVAAVRRQEETKRAAMAAAGSDKKHKKPHGKAGGKKKLRMGTDQVTQDAIDMLQSCM